MRLKLARICTALALLSQPVQSIVDRGFAQPIASPPPEETPAGSLHRLTNEGLQKIIQRNQERGEIATINHELTDALGLTSGDERLPVRQLTEVFDTGRYIFVQPSRDVNGYIFGAITSAGTFIFLVNRNLDFVSAAQKLKGQQIEPVADESAKKNLAVILDHWAFVAAEVNN